MPELIRRQVWAFAMPCAVLIVATAVLSGFWGAAPALPALLFSGVVLLIAGSLIERWRATRIVNDLDQLGRQLSVPELPDLTSLHPITDPGKNIARRLQVLVDRVQAAVHDEDVVRRDIEMAQTLRVGFVASMGHDLRGPLSSMLGFADLLLMDEDEISQRQRASVLTIRQRTLDLLTLIDEMLDWAKLEAGRLTLLREPMAGMDVVTEILKLAESRSAGRGLILNTEIAGPLPRVAVDTRHLPRAVVAVMGDAIRDASTIPLHLKVCTDNKGQMLFSLHDPSLLIRDEDQARFFEAFRPSYAPSGKRIAGLGLGAACAKAIFRAHGGDVFFTSSQSDGTRFDMTLPSATSMVATAPEDM